jgi:hypothetical protein
VQAARQLCREALSRHLGQRAVRLHVLRDVAAREPLHENEKVLGGTRGEEEPHDARVLQRLLQTDLVLQRSPHGGVQFCERYDLDGHNIWSISRSSCGLAATSGCRGRSCSYRSVNGPERPDAQQLLQRITRNLDGHRRQRQLDHVETAVSTLLNSPSRSMRHCARQVRGSEHERISVMLVHSESGFGMPACRVIELCHF